MRIILCDDDTAFTQVFEKRLLTVFKKYGITPEIVSAHTGVEALREITCRPTDVLFLDIDMPEKNGFSVAEELSAMPSIFVGIHAGPPEVRAKGGNGAASRRRGRRGGGADAPSVARRCPPVVYRYTHTPF